MRTFIAALALSLAACSPAEEEERLGGVILEHPPELPPSPLNLDAAALTHAPATGQWFERVDEGTFATGFGAPESEYQFIIVCTQGSGAINVTSSNELAPDQDTLIRIITSTQTLELPARSFNDGLPSIAAEVAESAPQKTPLIGMLGAPTDRFAVDAGGEITVYPWHDSIARTLIACR
jgi:hypothetical protein